MTTKKNESTTSGGDAASAQSKLNELYTAHQVHTLAQLIFQQIASGWSGPPNLASWTPGAGVGQHRTPGVTNASQPLMYWYP